MAKGEYKRRRSKDDAAIVARRSRVAQLMLAKITDQAAIAAQLGVTQPTISKDIAYLKQQWRESAEQDFAEIKSQELAELREMERQVAAGFVTTKDVRWISERRAIKDMVFDLLGLDAPIRVNTNLNATTKSTVETTGKVKLIVEYVDDPDVE